MYDDASSTAASIACIKGIISTLNLDILSIAKESISEEHIHPQLKDWGSSDFKYESHVNEYVWEMYEEDKPAFKNFLECLYKRVWRCADCKRNSSERCKSKGFREWETCSDFLDRGIKKKLTKCINDLGYSINDEGFIIYGSSNTFDPMKIIHDVQKASTAKITDIILPDDLIDKGKEMSEVYIFIYCIENSLRIFIEKCFKDHFGEDYLSQIKLTTDLKATIRNRKTEEGKHIYLPLRGDNDLFYLDLIDLRTVIRNNWPIFEKYFPSQDWIFVRIEDISKCRNFIAHNSYIENDEKMSLITNYKQIIKQINRVRK